ncbi:MAG: nucleotide exchange factor GrpE [Planctomycetota bacterium]|nr:MAG: nucleotide exchange factor GrpE [Planctomycetota bacterium]
MGKSTEHKRDERRSAGGAGDQAEQLRERVEALEAELAEAREAKQRALADFLNYQKRAIVNEREAREDGAGRVLESLLSVADYLDMALKQDPDAATAKAILDGVWLIREELHKVFQEHGVTPIRPEPGTPADPTRHDAIGHEPAQGVAPGEVARVEQPGYEFMGRVLRPAKVYVAPDTGAAQE